MDRLTVVAVKHPTWTHGELVDRSVSLVRLAEFALHGFSILGPRRFAAVAGCLRRMVRRQADDGVNGAISRTQLATVQPRPPRFGRSGTVRCSLTRL